MSSFDSLIDGFASALTLSNLGFGLLGTFLGTLVGVLPGIGPALAIALLLPITYTVSPASALIMFAAIYYGAMYGGSTTSILLNTPGESGSVITALEGNKMARNGRAGPALATAAIGSFVAGTIATLILAFTAPTIADLAIKVGAADYVALMLVAFTTVSSLLGASQIRGFISLAVGLVLGLVGADLQSGLSRLTFGNQAAVEGIETVPVIVSIFALGEALYIASRFKEMGWNIIPMKGKAMMSRDDLKRSWKPWLRGTALGFPLGVIPAGGSEVPTFLSYSVEKKLSKHPEEFGHGAIEGVAGPEAANNANAAGALVPLLALGLPTSATAAVILVAFQTYQIQPGPTLFLTNGALIWTLIASLFIGNTLLLILNLPLVRVWVQLLKVPRPYLFAGIVTFAMLGAYALNTSTFDVQVAIAIGIVGFLFRRFGMPITPLILGLILGPNLELQFRRALQISAGDYGTLWASPLSKVLYAVLLIALFTPIITKVMRKVRKDAHA
ncbi:putative tricarboxylic transport membrane protein [Candidatus Planktophila dulcis]|uniref:tripartite tricarboxylate transporter permease n=1 Tax=Candidatus Planktophila dulcis TaxID=1884914 RepID=UPI000BAC5139|nr:tripartite tricarboxylate transporter permease [Candidatus Planktophila dulcis]ASY21652.1 putative tricarboxylic transport membrane protein [Candidatus Planktophila dulcis]